VHNLNTQNQKLTNSILSNIEDDLLQTRKQINQNIDLINKIIETKKLTYNDVDYLIVEHRNIKFTFNNIIKQIIAIKSENYIDGHLITNDPMTALIKIPELYNDYVGEFHVNESEISLEHNDLETFILVKKAYEFYNISLSKIDGQIDITKDYWIDQLNIIYNKNLEQIE